MDELLRVRVLGREYALRVRKGEEALTRRLAEQVDARMRSFKDAHPDQSELTAAVLSALTLAEDLFTLREQYAAHDAALAEGLDGLADDLARLLAAAAPDDGAGGEASAGTG